MVAQNITNVQKALGEVELLLGLVFRRRSHTLTNLWDLGVDGTPPSRSRWFPAPPSGIQNFAPHPPTLQDPGAGGGMYGSDVESAESA